VKKVKKQKKNINPECCNLFLDPRIKKKLEIQKIIAVRKECWSVHKIVKNWFRRLKITKFEI